MLEDKVLYAQSDEVIVDVCTSAMIVLVMLKSPENEGWIYHSTDETMWLERRLGYQN